MERDVEQGEAVAEVSTQGGQSRRMEREGAWQEVVVWGLLCSPRKCEAQGGLGCVPVTGRSTPVGRRSRAKVYRWE